MPVWGQGLINVLGRVTQGVARGLALPWAVIGRPCRAWGRVVRHRTAWREGFEG